MGSDTPVVIHGDNFLALTVNPAAGGAQTDAHHRAWLAGTELKDLVWIDTHTLQATVPAGLTPGPQKLEVENAFGNKGQLDNAFVVTGGALSAELAADHATVSAGQTGTLTLTVTNTGVKPVSGINPGTVTTSGGTATITPTGQSSIPLLNPNEKQTFTWSFKTSAAGKLSFGASATGYDSASQSSVSAAGTAPVAVQTAAVLTASLVPDAAAASAGDKIVLSLKVTNSGGADAATALNVTSAWPTMSSQNRATAKVTATPEPVAIPSLAAGESHTFKWELNALTGGTLTIGAAGAGVDANSGATVNFGPAGTQVGIQQLLADLTVVGQLPSAPPGGTFTVTMNVTNSGDAAVTAITAGLQLDSAFKASGAPVVACANSLTCLALNNVPLTQPSANLFPLGVASFTWQYTNVTASPVTVVLGGTATGTGQGDIPVKATAAYP